MKLIFAGTPVFAARALDALADAGHDIVLVLTQPDRPAGRGLRLQPSAVKERAVALGLAVEQPDTLRDPGAAPRLAALDADAMVVAAYGLLLPPAILMVPRLGCLNIHASLLPRWRGAAPIQRALLAGDIDTGITIMQMDAGLDTGAILLQRSTPIAMTDTATTLHDRLATMGAELIVEALQHPLTARAQDAALATYAAKLTKAEAEIRWADTADHIDRQIRAFNPVPGAATRHGEVQLKLWMSELAAGTGEPGTVLHADASGVVVACGEGAVRILELQRAGGKRLPAGPFLTGHPLPTGTRVG